MGFRCPVCKCDFGREKDKWIEHCKSAHEGTGEKIVETIKKIVEDKSA